MEKLKSPAAKSYFTCSFIFPALQILSSRNTRTPVSGASGQYPIFLCFPMMGIGVDHGHVGQGLCHHAGLLVSGSSFYHTACVSRGTRVIRIFTILPFHSIFPVFIYTKIKVLPRLREAGYDFISSGHELPRQYQGISQLLCDPI